MKNIEGAEAPEVEVISTLEAPEKVVEEGGEKPSSSAGVRPRKFPTWTDLFATVGVFVLSVLVGSLVAGVLMASKGVATLTPDITFIFYLIQMMPTIAFVVWRRHRAGLDVGIHLGIGRIHFPMILWGVVVLLASGVVIEPLLELFPSAPYEAVQQTIGLGGWAIMSTVVAAPILEEVLFRGVIFESCRERLGKGGAVLLSALLFGLIHGIPVQIVNAFVVGLILGYIYLRTRSLMSVIVLHAINNGLAYISMAFFDDGGNVTLGELISVRWLYWVVYGLSAAIFLFAMVRLWRQLRDNREVE
ncbi:MAG: CPBP family intramembrane metalloprotease [Tidjanibacter sp.]|nr:CPBP family intramembrane metalloprotease [Tidjanibacter sp.]